MALETSTWLNPCFMEKVLRKSEGDNSIQVIDIFSKPATSKGDNYTSDMLRVNVDFTRNQQGQKINEKKSVIIKIAPMTEGMRKELVMKSGIFDTEMTMMTDTLIKMNKLLGPENRISGLGLYVQKENPTLLVMEDLATLGYRMACRHAGLDLDHCKLAIRGLARFHASSVAVCEKDPNQKQMYLKGMFNKLHPPEMGNFFILSAKGLASEVKKWPELDKKYSEKIANIAEHIYQIGIKACECTDDDFQVISHGDFWVNNMLFKYDNDKPISHIAVDFQMCSYTSPAIDIHYFLSTSPAVEVIENNKAALLDEYLAALTTTMKQLKCKTQPPTMEKLKAALKQRASYGMIASFTVLPIVLCEKDDLKDIDEMLGKDGTTYDNSSMNGKNYRKVMTKRIPMYDQLGLLDF